LEKDVERNRRSRGGRAVFIVVKKSSKATVYAPSLIKQLLNLGRQTLQLRLLYIKQSVIIFLKGLNIIMLVNTYNFKNIINFKN